MNALQRDDAESQRLTGPGTRLADEIGSAERDRDGERLDRKGRRDASIGKRLNDLWDNAQVREGLGLAWGFVVLSQGSDL